MEHVRGIMSENRRVTSKLKSAKDKISKLSVQLEKA